MACPATPTCPTPSAAVRRAIEGPGSTTTVHPLTLPAGPWVPAVVAILLALYAALAWSGSWSKGVSFDEGLQLAIGYNIWRNHDLRIEGANGDFVKRWATLPYLISRPNFVARDDPFWKKSRSYDLARRFLFECGNQPEALLRQARAMIALLGVATGFLVFRSAREIFGDAGALVSLVLFVLSPSMLAFGGIVSTDMSITLTLFNATWCIWRLLHEVTPVRLGLSLLCVGVMVLAKTSALVIFPVTAVLVIVRLTRGDKLLVRGWGAGRAIAGRWRLLGVFAALAAAHVVSGWLAIWAHYEFRYQASPEPGNPEVVFYQPRVSDAVPPVLQSTLAWIERTRFLPEGFWRGVDALLRCDDALGSFMHGQWSIRGHPAFFPYAIWVKTPPATFLLLALGLVAWWGFRRRASTERPVEHHRRAETLLYALTPHVALIGCYLAIAMTEDINIGHRHVLPIYPPLFVLAGAVALGWREHGGFRLATLFALGWLAFDSFTVRPHYLAYFGVQAGGPDQGYRSLVDSSLDWGMDLPALKHWIDEHDPQHREAFSLAYFGTDDPEHYGIRAIRLPSFMERPLIQRYALRPGYFAISASLFQGVYTAAFGPWNKRYEQLYQTTLENAAVFETGYADPTQRRKLFQFQPLEKWMEDYDLFDNLRFARLCAWLRQHGPPPQLVAHTILVWKLDRTALEAALVGPPPELVEAPAVVRRFRRIQTRPPPSVVAAGR